MGLGVSFLFLSSCQKEDLELETKSHQHLKAEFISTNQLLNELENPNVLDFVRNNLFHSIEQNKLLRTNESTNLFQKIVLPEYTTYTYKIDYYNPLKPIIKYFIITKDKNGIEKACYVNYTPSNYTYKLDLSKFSGKLEMFTVENELYSSTVYLNGKPFKDNDPNKIQYQTYSCIISSTITVVPCSRGQNHGVGDTCYINGVATPSDAFYSVSTTVVCITLPNPVYIAPIIDYAGGGGGGGNDFEGIPIPPIYDGEEDVSNTNWLYALNVRAFTNSLPAVANNVLAQNWWMFPNIVQWFKDNNGLTQQNKLTVANAIMKLNFIRNIPFPNSTALEINQFSYFAFMFFLNNPSYTIDDYNNNKSDFEIDDAEVDNYTTGGYDTTPIEVFNPQQQPWPTIPSVIPINKFVGWNRVLHPNWECMEYSIEQLKVMGYQISSYYSPGQTFQIYTKLNGVNTSQLANGLSYLKSALSRGIPIIVGIDHSITLTKNIDLTTDHFIVVVGMGTDFTGDYFQFFDNANSNSSKGTSSLNKLYYNAVTGIISGTSQATPYATGKTYKITMIRKSKIR